MSVNAEMGAVKIVNAKVFVALLAASVLANVAALPYLYSLAKAANIKMPPIPLPILVLLQTVQATVLSAAAILAGLYLGRKVGLGAPLLEDWFAGRLARHRLASIIKLASILGMTLGAALFILDRYVFAVFVQPITSFQAAPPLWRRFLVCFYGGICEEIFMRLLLVTLLVWGFWKIRKAADVGPPRIAVWSAIVVVSIIFGLGHLPMTGRFVDITAIVVVRAVVLNGIAGVVFGWLYWRKGLESAIVSHFSADVVLHVILPTLL